MKMKKKECAESSASNWASFKESIPKKMSIESAAEPGGTLMGRLAARMASRDMIDSMNLGPKGKTLEARKATVADGDAAQAKMAESAEFTVPSKMMMGAGLHEQMHDNKSSNFSNPIPNNKKLPGNTMKDQAKNAGNYYEDNKFLEKFGIRGREVSDHLSQGAIRKLDGVDVQVKKKLNKGYVVKELPGSKK